MHSPIGKIGSITIHLMLEKNLFNLKCLGFSFFNYLPLPLPHLIVVSEVHVSFTDFETMFRDTKELKIKSPNKTKSNLRYCYLSHRLKCNAIAFHQKYMLSLLYYRHSSV